MVAKRKLYHDPTGRIKIVWARVYWTPTFMEILTRKFGFFKEFTMEEAEEFFSRWYPYISKNAIRHKILRLYRKEWLKRELKEVRIHHFKRKVYHYSLTEKAKRYYMYWGGFNSCKESPLMRRIPEIPV